MNFSELYFIYYPKLVRFAKEFVILEEDAENITQDIFMNLWERRNSLNHINNMNAYLFKLVKNRCLDHLKHKIFEQKYAETEWASFKVESFEDYDVIEKKDMEELIRFAINSLPERCREIFLLSRFRNLKYKEISDHLSISVNTVECQMGIALRKLRSRLGFCPAI